MKDIEFKQTATGPLKLNVYSPKQGDGFPGPHPLIVYLFGGAWRVGDRYQVESWMNLTSLTQLGFVVASLDYRLSNQALFPAQIEDVWDGIGWLIDHADRFVLDADRVGVVGPSAGGHLAALAGTTSGMDSFGARTVQAVADFYGPTDFRQMDEHSLSDTIVHDDENSPESMLVGGKIQEQPVLSERANPVSYVNGDVTGSAAGKLPPFLIVHGQLDPLVPHHQSELLVEALQAARVPVEFHSLPDAGHGGFESPVWLDRVARFFNETL